MNDNGVTPAEVHNLRPQQPQDLEAFAHLNVTSHADEARHFAEESEVHTSALTELYTENRRDSQRIAVVHQNLRTSLALARTHALLAIADELRLIRIDLTEVQG